MTDDIETATVHGSARRVFNPIERVLPTLAQLDQGTLRCRTCHRLATTVRRDRHGRPYGLCHSPTCRENAQLDAQLAALRRARRRRGATR